MARIWDNCNGEGLILQVNPFQLCISSISCTYTITYVLFCLNGCAIMNILLFGRARKIKHWTEFHFVQIIDQISLKRSPLFEDLMLFSENLFCIRKCYIILISDFCQQKIFHSFRNLIKQCRSIEMIKLFSFRSVGWYWKIEKNFCERQKIGMKKTKKNFSIYGSTVPLLWNGLTNGWAFIWGFMSEYWCRIA